MNNKIYFYFIRDYFQTTIDSHIAHNSHADYSYCKESPVLTAKEKKRKGERVRYARMTDEEKQEKLKRRREAYHQKKAKDSTQIAKRIEENKKYTEKQQRQKCRKKERERQYYEKMQPEKRKSRIEKITNNKELKRSTNTKDSIAMENPAYIETELEVTTSTFNVKQTPQERQTSLDQKNEENTSKMKDKHNDREHLQQKEDMSNGNTIILHNTLTTQINIIFKVKLTTFFGQTFPIQCVQTPKTKMDQEQPTVKIMVSTSSYYLCSYEKKYKYKTLLCRQ
jgi:hypothetical protein